jgi:hypothetical protein
MVTAAYFKSFDAKYFSCTPKTIHIAVVKNCVSRQSRASQLFANLTAMYADIIYNIMI